MTRGRSWPGDLAARREWQAARDRAEIPREHPAPEVPMRPAEDSEMPRAALSLRLAAERAGWVRCWYSRGTLTRETHKIKGADRTIDVISVRFHTEDGRYGVALWQREAGARWAAVSAWIWGAGAREALAGHEGRSILVLPRQVAFMPGESGKYTIRDWVAGKGINEDRDRETEATISESDEASDGAGSEGGPALVGG